MVNHTIGPSAPSRDSRRREARALGHFLEISLSGSVHSVQVKGLIDTGASDICIDYRLARQLELTPVDQGYVGGIGGSVLATIYRARLHVPDLDYSSYVRVYALNARRHTHDVLLGRSFLESFVVTFDGPEGLCHFSSSRPGLAEVFDE